MNSDFDNFIPPSHNSSSLENSDPFFDFSFPSSPAFETSHSKTNTSPSFESHGSFAQSEKYKPFKIIRESPNGQVKLSTQSHKIKKTRKSKKGFKLKQDIARIMIQAPKKYIPAEIEDPSLDDKIKRGLVQKVKNRIASQNTRDQRRKYITELEEVKIHLAKANEELNERNRLLEERLKAIENERMALLAENQELKRQNVLNTQAENFITYEATSPVLSRSSSKGRSPSYKFFLGTFMAFAVYSVVNEVLAYREEAEEASAKQIVRAGRTSRTEKKSLRVLHFFYAMLSILFICYFAVINGERWKKINIIRKLLRE